MKCKQVRECLFAFLDSELDAASSIRFQRHIEHCPGCAREVEIERAIRKQLTSSFESSDTVPFDQDGLCRQLGSNNIESEKSRASGLRRAVFVITSSAAVLLLGVTAWHWSRPAAKSQFADWVVADFQHFVDKGQQVQYASADAAAVSQWLCAKTGLDVSLPPGEAGGCRLVGARKCSFEDRPAAFAAYELAGDTASLLVLKGAGLDLEQFARVDHDGRVHWVDRCKGYTVVACERGDLLYAAVSKLPEPELLCLVSGADHEGN